MSDEMEKLSRILFEEKEDNSARLKTLGLNTDGDFVIFILKKSTHQIRILNDFLGRLPCYWYKQGGVFMLSRELRFIANLIGNRKYDRMGIAQCLLFGYPLADRMLLEGVQRLRPATLVRINFASLETSMESLHTFNFDSKEHAHRTVQENSAELVRLFRESCRQRACATGHNVVSLGGGLDSRSVAAGLSEERLPFLAVTFLNHDRSMSSVRVGGVKKQN
jgi:asparagine synthase (glutamine-hydrolysing)